MLVSGHPLDPVILSSFFSLLVFSLFALWSLEWWKYPCNTSAFVTQLNWPFSAPVTCLDHHTTPQYAIKPILKNVLTRSNVQYYSFTHAGKSNVTGKVKARSELLHKISPPQRYMFVILCNKFIIKTGSASASASCYFSACWTNGNNTYNYILI